MKRFIKTVLVFSLFSLTTLVFGQVKSGEPDSSAIKMTEEELAEMQAQTENLVYFLEYIFKTLGDPETPQVEKDIILKDTYAKYFVDAKVQVEDDLIPNREVVTNKDVVAYLQDIDFFFKNVNFKFTIDNIQQFRNEDGDPYFLASTERLLTGETIKGEPITNNKPRYIEMNVDGISRELKIASIYTTKLSEDQDLIQWWNSLSAEWKELYAEQLPLGDSIPSTNFQVANSRVIIPASTADSLKLGINIIGYIKKLQDARELDLSGRKGVVDLSPVSKMRELKVIDISGTGVVDLSPLRSITTLETFRCSQTLVGDISYLQYCSELKTLDLSNSMINNLESLKPFQQLERLDISGCKLLTSIEQVSSLTQLKDLRISNTSISSLKAVGALANLSVLHIAKTQIEDLTPLQKLTQLEQVYMEYTKISSLEPLKFLASLRKIYCDNSRVDREEVQKFIAARPNVTIIYASDMLVRWWENMPDFWQGILQDGYQPKEGQEQKEYLHEVIGRTSLNLTNNQRINSLQPLTMLGNLKELKISGTQVKTLDPIKDLKDLRVLHLNETPIASLMALSGLNNLEELEANDTPVADVSPLKGLSALRSVKLNKTMVSGVADLAALPSLNVLEVDGSRLSTSEVIKFYQQKPKGCTIIYQTEKLSRWWYSMTYDWKEMFGKAAGLVNVPEHPSDLELHMIGRISELKIKERKSSFRYLAQLEMLRVLDISDLRLTELKDLEMLEQLEILKLNQNPVSNISALRKLNKLKELDLSNTLAEDLGAISGLASLEVLKLAGTNVDELDDLSGLRNLRVLDISNTRVKKLDPIDGLRKMELLECYKTRLNDRRVDDYKSGHRRVEVVFY